MHKKIAFSNKHTEKLHYFKTKVNFQAKTPLLDPNSLLSANAQILQMYQIEKVQNFDRITTL